MMTSDKSLDERYLEWLYSLIGIVRNNNPRRSHWLLTAQLYQKEFLWYVPNDDNRVADGLDLREEFINCTGAERDRTWLEEGCSVLEMLIALCRRIEFESVHDSYYWFWKIIENLHLQGFVDEEYSDDNQLAVEDIFNTVIDRTYDSNGDGGLFPLKHPNQDQRRVEIWYQMSAYLLENSNEY
jgi:hypothetical protein